MFLFSFLTLSNRPPLARRQNPHARPLHRDLKRERPPHNQEHALARGVSLHAKGPPLSCHSKKMAGPAAAAALIERLRAEDYAVRRWCETERWVGRVM